MRVLMLAANSCAPDARVMREAETLASAGYDVRVFAQAAPGVARDEVNNGVRYQRLAGSLRSKTRAALDSATSADQVIAPTAPAQRHSPQKTSGGWRQSRVRRRLAQLVPMTGPLLVHFAHQYTTAGAAFNPEVVHAHDLGTLLAGYRIARRTGAKLIYDSHELETGRNAPYTTYERWLRARYERFLIAKTDAVITVSDSIADYLAQLYAIARPAVVLNAPSMAVQPANGDTIRQRLGLAVGVPLAVYVGSVTINRGLENCVRALVHAPALHIAAVGPRASSLAQALVADSVSLGVQDRFHLIDPVPHEAVTAFIASADLSLILIQDVCLSYRFCFPNKLLESLLGGVPILVSRLVELERMIAKTSAGLVVDQTDPVAIAHGALCIASNRSRFAPGADTIEDIRRTYAWEAQGRVLLDVYSRLCDTHTAPLSAPRKEGRAS